MLFACPSTYVKDVPQDLLGPHRAWIAEQVEANVILSAGRLAAGGGGLILLRAADEAAALEILASDPFSKAGISVYRPIGFTPGLGTLEG